MYNRMIKKKRVEVMQWPSQSPDLSLVEMLWQDLKTVVDHNKMKDTVKNTGPKFLHRDVRD